MADLLENIVTALSYFVKCYYTRLLNLDVPVLCGTFCACSYIIFSLATENWNFRRTAFQFVKRLPIVSSYIQKQLDKALKDIHNAIHSRTSHITYQKRLPTCGLSADVVYQTARKYKAMEYIKWHEGFASGSVYPRDDVLTDLSSKIIKTFAWTNPLHPDLFPDIRRMEAEIVRMCVTMFHGDKDACGTTSSGGTESIMLACYAYRELARERGISHPNMVVPISAHAAFDKAAHYFSIDMIHVPVDPVTLKVDLVAMKSAINSGTCMLVGSAPGFPHGIIDPIAEISVIGKERNIPVHVDCCLGGFLLPFMDKVDFPLELFDFRLPGVTSISCDTHKYGFAVKGTSVIMYRNKTYRAKQFFSLTTWPGGLYASPTFAGSRSGAVIAACWASMLYHGESGYCESTRRIVSTTRFIASELRKIPGIFVFGEPQVSVVAFGSNIFNIYSLAEILSDMPNGRGWNLNNLQFPPAVHLCVTDMHTEKGRAESFIEDVAHAARELIEQPRSSAEGAAALYGMSQLIPDRSLVAELTRGFLDACYDTPN